DSMRTRRSHPAMLVAAVPLLAAACSAGGTPAPSAMPSESGMAEMSEMPMASGLANLHWKVTATGITNGATITDNSVTLDVARDGYTFSCAWAGKPNKDTVGHYHVELDHALVNMYCTPTATISLQNVAPGKHTLTVIPATDSHDELTDAEVSVNFTY